MEKTNAVELNSQPKDDFDFAIPDFDSPAEFETWWNSHPSVDIEFDERLGQRLDVQLTLNRRVVDGFHHLAKQKGLKNGEDLMKVILGKYLSDQLPDDF